MHESAGSGLEIAFANSMETLPSVLSRSEGFHFSHEKKRYHLSLFAG